MRLQSCRVEVYRPTRLHLVSHHRCKCKTTHLRLPPTEVCLRTGAHRANRPHCTCRSTLPRMCHMKVCNRIRPRLESHRPYRCKNMRRHPWPMEVCVPTGVPLERHLHYRCMNNPLRLCNVAATHPIVPHLVSLLRYRWRRSVRTPHLRLRPLHTG